MGAFGTATPASPPLPAPTRVGRYEIVSRIASGGMATVYLARARGVGGFERDVALKLTHAHLRESPEFAAVLLEEAKLAVRVRHSNVVSILDVGEDPNGVFLVMEYVEGATLLGLMRAAEAQGRAVPIGIGVRVLLDALAGLHAAHELTGDDGAPLDVVHRDFSPANVLVGCDGVAKLTDFGIAKAATSVGQTATGVVKGKVAYMAPEQARGHNVDRRCDVWAAGIVAWEILAGRRLYPKNEDGVPVLLKVVSEEPPRLRSVRADVPEEVEEAVASALTMDLSRRCESAQIFARRLAAAIAPWERIAESLEVGEHVKVVAGRKPAAPIVEATTLVREAQTEAAPTQMNTVTDPPAQSAPRRRIVVMAGAAIVTAALAVGTWAALSSEAAPAAGSSPSPSPSPSPPPSPSPSPSPSTPTASASVPSPAKPRPRPPASAKPPSSPLAPSPYDR